MNLDAWRPQKLTVQLVIPQTVVFLQPSARPYIIPSEDPIIKGKVILTLPRAKAIKKVVVKVVGHSSVFFPGFTSRWETGYSLEKKVKIELMKNEGMLPKGVHEFEFSLIIPSSTSPYAACKYGRVYHKVTSMVETAGVTHSKFLDEKMVYLVVNPADQGQTMVTDIRSEHFTPDLGPCETSFTSHHLTIGGLAHFKFALHSPPGPLKIHCVSAIITQSIFLTSIEDPKVTLRPPVVGRTMFRLDATSPARRPPPMETPVSPLSSGQQRLGAEDHPDMVDQSLPAAVASLQYFEIAHLFRLPNEDILQPTTQVGTRSAVHTTHHVIFRVEYTRVGGGGLDRKPMAITSSHPITISSCLCMLESVLLPSYSEVDPFPVIRTEDRYSRRNRDTCVCGSPLETLVAQEGGLLIEAVQSDEVLAKVTHE